MAILELIALAGIPFSINEVVKKLRLNKSTVFNIMHTLADLNVLERGSDGLFRLGTRLYVLGSAAAKGNGLIQTVHPYLVEINRKTKLSAFLGIRSGLKASHHRQGGHRLRPENFFGGWNAAVAICGGRRQGVDVHASG